MEEKNKKIADAPAADEKNAVSSNAETADPSVSDDAAAQEEFAFLLEGAEEKTPKKPAEDDFSLLIKDAAEKAEAAVHGEFAFIPEEKPAEEKPQESPQESEPPQKPEPEQKKKKEKKPGKAEKSAKQAEKPAEDAAEKPADPEEIAPPAEEAAVPETSAPAQAPKKEKSILGISLPLIIICMTVALMLSAVNLLTKDVITANAVAEKQNAVLAIFPEATGASLYEETETEEIYLAVQNNELVGCCIGLSENGFGGAISLLVGLDTNGAVSGIEIISMSETPGIGSKAKNDSFLSRYKGSEPFVIGENLDAISGATITSRAITRAVNRALEIPLDFEKMASGMGLSVRAADEIPSSADSAAAQETKPAETTAAPTPAETTAVPETTETAAVTEPSETTTVVAASASVQSITHTRNTNPVRLVSEETVYTAETETPAETEVPAETTGAAETDAPAETNAPAETTGAAETDAPAETNAPAETTTAASTAAAETANP